MWLPLRVTSIPLGVWLDHISLDCCSRRFSRHYLQKEGAVPAAAAAAASGALSSDSKNYHAWAHRQVVVAAAGAWQQERDYVEGLLQQDVRNNSAWNQRFFVLQVWGRRRGDTRGSGLRGAASLGCEGFRVKVDGVCVCLCLTGIQRETGRVHSHHPRASLTHSGISPNSDDCTEN